MIDFACKRFDIAEIIKCSLNLTKSEFRIFNFFIKNYRNEFISSEIASKLNLDLTTVQKGVKKLFEQKIILRHQKNLSSGGYVYSYEGVSKKSMRDIIKKIISFWFEKVSLGIDCW